MGEKTLNIKGILTSLKTPLVMGILNITPDSFYSDSRKQTQKEIEERLQVLTEEGADMIDAGGYSSRPDAADVSSEEEMKRLIFAMQLINRHCPEAVISVDTFRASIARRCVEEYGAAIINDISGGELDEKMFDTVARLNVPYILMHMKGTPQTMRQHTDYKDLMEDVMLCLAAKIKQLRLMGVNDIIVDPGFGFSKTTEQSYRLMACLKEFCTFGLPLLAGISRKSMIYRFLDCTPADSLNGTTVLNTYALLNGADILRVHDVKAAKEAIKIIEQLKLQQQ